MTGVFNAKTPFERAELRQVKRPICCPCLQKCDEESTNYDYSYWSRPAGTHFAEMWRLAEDRVDGIGWSNIDISMMAVHYEAHLGGYPHSHITFKRGPAALSWDGGGCDCHHVEQNYTIDPDIMRRGPGLVNPGYIMSGLP